MYVRVERISVRFMYLAATIMLLCTTRGKISRKKHAPAGRYGSEAFRIRPSAWSISCEAVAA
jgi:hypothetical protein